MDLTARRKIPALTANAVDAGVRLARMPTSDWPACESEGGSGSKDSLHGLSGSTEFGIRINLASATTAS